MRKNITQNLIENGYYKFKLKKKNYRFLKNKLTSSISPYKKINLSNIHNKIKIKDLNKMRLKVFKKINKDVSFKKNLFESARNEIETSVGNEVSCSDINLSIQLPLDQSSLLSMHTDFFSGESIFQINLWIPFMDVKKTQSMFIVNPKNSLKILKQIKNNKRINFNDIEKKYSKFMNWISLKEGEGFIFSPNCIHGNIVNVEQRSRISINVRYKNLFSPYSNFKNEKKIGTFYKPLYMSSITKFNLKYDFDEIAK